MPKTGNKNTKGNAVPTLATYIAQQIAAKRAAALDKSRNRTSVRVPMIPNPMTEEQWRNYVNNNIRFQEEQLSRIMSRYDQYKNRYGIRAIQDEQEALDKYLEEKDKGYPKLVPGSNCMYNAGDCYGLNIPGNLTFAAKHKELGFKKAPKGSMEPGDIVQDVSTRKPIHAMIYDSKDSEGNLLFNYARGHTGDDAFDINENYIKQGKYTIPIKDFDIYKYVGTPADSTQWINEYKQKYGKGMRCGGRRKAQLGLDICEGGIAIPIAPNMYYMDGRSHDNGGIAIGPNNKNGLEVEGGEVVKVGKNDVKVFSSVPLLRGVSPAQLVMGGANPNTVFEAQEKFKDRNRINDDGTTYEVGGEKIYTPSKTIQRQIQETGRVTIGGAPTIGGLRTYSYIKGLANVRKYSNAATNIFRIGKELIRRGTEKLVDNGKISRNVAQIPRSIYSQFVGRDGQNLPKTISLINNNMKEKKFGGNMIYTINGNVKNGLLSTRPKAEWGKGKSEYKWLRTKNANMPRGYAQRTPYGEIYDNGESYLIIKDGDTNHYINDTYSDYMDYAIKYQANKRPQFYAKKELPIAGNQSLAEKAGLARSGWSYADNPTFDYVPKINISVPTNYVKVVGNNAKKSTTSTPRGGESKSIITTKSKIEPAYINYTPNKVSLAIKADAPTSRTLTKIDTSSTGGGTQSKDGRWVGQYKPITTSDWIGLAANGLGSISSYLLTKSGIDKMPDPIKPIMASAAKLKTRYNVEPQLSETREAELTNRASVRRNTQSSNTSLAREQRLMNEARNASNTLYGQKENIETQLINQDRLNRQSVIRDNVRTYNDYLTRLGANRQAQSQLRISNVNNLISGLTGSVNNILSTIESRRATNNTIRAIAAANPNVDARLIGGFDYYIDPVTKKMYNKNQQYVRTIND